MLSVQDGNYATQYFLQDLPENAGVVGRMPKNAALYERPGLQPEEKPGPDPEKGDEIGSPEEVAEQEVAEQKLAEGNLEWQKHPTEEEAEVYSFEAIWQSVLPGQVLRVVLLRRPHLKDADSAKKRKRYLEAFFTTDLRLGPEQVLREYRGRWSIEILIREAKESFGLGEDRCRDTRKIRGTDNFRLLIGAAEVLCTAETQESEKQEADAQEPDAQEPPDEFDRLRPWYEDPGGPNLFDVHWGIREELAEAGITPKVGLNATPGEFDQNGASVQPRAA